MSTFTATSAVCRQLSGLAIGAVLCCGTAFAQMGGQQMGGQTGGAMQQTAPSQTASPNSMQSGSMGSMNQMGNTNMASPADKMFLKDALQGSMAEVQLGQLALSKSSNDQVKQFAQKMIDDHTKLIEQTKPVAAQNDVQIPNGPDKKSKAVMAKLQALSGDAFDQAYIKDMLKDHKMDDSDFKTEVSSGQSQQVKDLAAKGDAVVEHHLQMVEQIAKSMNVSTGE